MRPVLPVIIFVSALGVAVSASGQTIDGPAYFAPIADNVQPLIYGNVFSPAYLEKQKRARAGREGGKRQATASARGFRIDSDAEASASVRQQYVGGLQQGFPPEVINGLGLGPGHDIRSLAGKAMRPYGLRVDDLADLTTAWLVVMWMTANQAPLPERAPVRAVRAQVRELLPQGNGLPASAVERQRRGEAIMYQLVTVIRLREVATQAGNRDFLARLADFAQSTMAQHGFDLRASQLGDAGLVAAGAASRR